MALTAIGVSLAVLLVPRTGDPAHRTDRASERSKVVTFAGQTANEIGPPKQVKVRSASFVLSKAFTLKGTRKQNCVVDLWRVRTARRREWITVEMSTRGFASSDWNISFAPSLASIPAALHPGSVDTALTPQQMLDITIKSVQSVSALIPSGCRSQPGVSTPVCASVQKVRLINHSSVEPGAKA